MGLGHARDGAGLDGLLEDLFTAEGLSPVRSVNAHRMAGRALGLARLRLASASPRSRRIAIDAELIGFLLLLLAPTFFYDLF